MIISLVRPHFTVRDEWEEQTEEKGDSVYSSFKHSGMLEVEGELVQLGERWVLICRGMFELSEQVREQAHGETEDESEHESNGVFHFEAGVLLHPGHPALLAGSGERKLVVSLVVE